MPWATVLSRGPKCQPQHHNIIIRWKTIQNMLSENVKTAGNSRSVEACRVLLNNLAISSII